MAANLPLIRSKDFLNIFKNSSKVLREIKKVNPSDRYVLLYPDSDSAYVGMGFNLLNRNPAEEVFAIASKILKKDILKLCLDGPKSDLIDSFENQQIATFVTSHATMAKFAHDKPIAIPFCKSAGGIGVGFINSLVFSGSMSFENGLDLVLRRAKAMERATKIVPNSKLRIRLRPATSRSKLCRAAIEECRKLGLPEEISICSISKTNYANNIEIAGHEEAIRYLEREGPRLFEFRDIKRVLRNPYAYHSELMRPASEFIREYLNQRTKEDPDYLREPERCSVYSATAGRRLRSRDSIIQDIYNHPVRSLKVEQLLHCLFSRHHDVPQPNILVIWDKKLLRFLSMTNRKAFKSAKLLAA